MAKRDRRIKRDEFEDWTPDQPLPNTKWELWVCKVLSGSSKNEAARECGYAQNHSTVINNNKYVRARMVYLQELAAERAAVTSAWWLRELYAIANSDITELVTWAAGNVELDDDGEPVGGFMPRLEAIASDLLPKSVRKTIKKIKIKYHRMTDEVDMEFEMHDKLKALKLLGDFLGVTDPKSRSRTVDSMLREASVDGGRSLTNEDLQQLRQIAWED